MKGLVLAALVLATAPLYADYTPFYLGLLTEVLVFGLFATRAFSRSGTPRSWAWPPTSPASSWLATISRSS